MDQFNYRASVLRLVCAGKRTVFDIIQIHVASDLQVIASQAGRWTHRYLHGILDMAHFIENAVQGVDTPGCILVLAVNQLFQQANRFRR